MCGRGGIRGRAYEGGPIMKGGRGIKHVYKVKNTIYSRLIPKYFADAEKISL